LDPISKERRGFMEKGQPRKAMEKIVGREHVTENISPYSYGLADRTAYSREMMSHVLGEYAPDYVVMPGSVEEVQEIVRSANENDVLIYPYSRGTNVYCYTLAKKGGIILDLHRMDRILEVNEETMTATVEPGVSWGRLRKETLKKGMMIIPILGPHTGGVIGNYTSWNFTPYSTRFSPDRIVTLEVVLANGEILRTGSQALEGHEKINPYFRYVGPDITGIFRGSFGAFGIITKAVVKLFPILDGFKNITYGFEELEDGLDTMQAIEKLDITKSILMFNREWVGEMVDPELKYTLDLAGQKRILDKYPLWTLNVGICGKRKQLSFYEELIRDEVRGGEAFRFEGEALDNWEDFAPGAGSRVTTMYGSARAGLTSLTVTPFSVCPAVYEVTLKKIKEFDFRDPISGHPWEPTVGYFPMERGRCVYCAIDYRFDATKPESIEKAAALCENLSLYYHEELGSSLVIINPLIRHMISPTYIDIFKKVKKAFDPEGILSKSHLLEDL
jgi:FAD/FMN-containing dehydrogenase